MATQTQNIDEYIADLKKQIADNDQCASHYYNLGMAYLSKRMFQEAEQAFRNAVEHSPRLAEAYVQLGGICMQRGDIEGCLNFNTMAKDSRMQFAVPWANMGFCYLQMGEVDRAIVHLKKAINRDPQFVQAHTSIGSAYLMDGQLDEATTHLEKALAVEPNFGPAWHNLCLVHLERAEFAKAVECSDKAVASGYEIPPQIQKELEAYR